MPYGEAVPSASSAGFHILLQNEKKPYLEPTESSGENGSGPGIASIIGNWILATGFWVDTGVWIDGDLWID